MILADADNLNYVELSHSSISNFNKKQNLIYLLNMMTLKRNQIIGLSILAAGSLFFVVMGTIMLQSSKIEISDLYVIDSKIEKVALIEIPTGRYGATRPALWFKLERVEIPLGISNLNKDEYDRYLSDIHIGDKMRVAYDPSASLDSNGINFSIYQLEKEGKKLIRIEDVQKQNRTMSSVFYLFAVIMILIFLYLYRQIKRNMQSK